MDFSKAWESKEYERWVNVVKDSSGRTYKHTMMLYLQFSDMSPKELIDEAEKDHTKPLRERGTPERRLVDFYTWLIKEYKTSNVKGGKVGLSPYRAKGMVSSLKSFYKRNNYPIGDVKLPSVAPKKENARVELSIKDIRNLLEVVTSKRDKTLILFGFQGGFDADTVSKLNVGDIQDRDLNKMLNNEVCDIPLQLQVVREKEGIDYHTCLGFDTVDSLRAYLFERKMRGDKLELSNPLFTTEGTSKKKSFRIDTGHIHHMMRNAVTKSGIISKERLKRADFNPAGYHALRSTFSKRLEYAGMPVAYIDYMQGHSLPHGGAYRKPHPRKLLDKYKEFSHALEIAKAPTEITELEEKLRRELEKKDYVIRGLEERTSKLESLTEKLDKIILEKLGVLEE